MASSTDRLREFTAELLHTQGALIEPIEPQGLAIMLPESVAARLGVADDYLLLGFSAERPPEAEPVTLESEWLGRFETLLGQGGRATSFVNTARLPSLSKLERMLERNVVLQNATYRVHGVEPAWTRYLLAIVRYTALSDEKRVGILELGVNSATGSAIDSSVGQLLAMVLGGDIDSGEPPDSAELPHSWRLKALKALLSHSLAARVNSALAPFIQGMRRRLGRDSDRIYEYYQGLRVQSQNRLRKRSSMSARGGEEGARERLRIEAATREYHAKIADLRQKYHMRINTEVCQIIAVTTPVWRIALSIKRRKKARMLHLDWNPLVRRLDSLLCEWGDPDTAVRLVCDDDLHLVSEPGHSPCVACGKAYCRACAPGRCPRCGRRKPSGSS